MQSIAEYCRVLRSVTECYRVFLTHPLGPIFGLVLMKTLSNWQFVQGGNELFLYIQSIIVDFFQSKNKIGCVEFLNFQLIEVHCKIEGCILLPIRKEESKHLWILKPNSPLKYQKFYQILEILWMGRWKNIYIMFHGWKNIYLPFRLALPDYITALCAGHSKNIYFYIFLVC